MILKNNPLSRPFPDREFGRDTVMGIGRVAVFVFFALYLLRPIGFDASGNVALICLGYAVVTFIVGVLYAYVTEHLFGWQRSGNNWTLGRWIMDCGLLLLCISTGNFIYYNWLVGWTAFSVMVLAYVALPTVLIGLFPIAFSGMAIQLRAEREYRKTAQSIQLSQLNMPEVVTETKLVPLGKGELSLDPADLLFAESRQNYVRLAYFDAGEVTEQTIRTTLSGLEQQLAESALLRCHRSYLVNPRHVRRAEGNAQGLRLTMVGTEEEVPVSRAYVAILRERIIG